jgi:hypothetical protein
MKHIWLSLIATIALLALVGTSTANAYGNNAVYQIAFSGNCDNPASPVCAPPPNGFGLGGFWVWIVLDNDGTGDVAGAFCQHGLPTAPHGGAGSVKGDVTWTTITSSSLPAGAINSDPNNTYLVIPELGLVLPATPGHYSFRAGPAVQAQTQIVRIPGR